MRGNQPQLAPKGKAPVASAVSRAATPAHANGGHVLLENFPKPPGMLPAAFAKLQELCGPRTMDVLLHLPRTLLDRSATATLANAPLGERTTLVVKVLRRSPFPPRGTKRPLTIEVADLEGSPLRVLFFHPQIWLERAFPIGAEVIISGKLEANPKGQNAGKQMLHPDVWGGTRGLENIAKIWPVYPSTAGLAQGWQHRAAQAALALAEAHPLPEWLPKAQREAFQLPTFAAALQQAHQPTCPEDLAPSHPARVRLALDELYATQLALQHARAQTRMLKGLAHGRHTALREKLLRTLPYTPTADQTMALSEIVTDLQAPRPMLRLLQGDVGSGKTLVALLSALHVIENGHQVALMAPTEILAQQLFFNAQQLLQPLGITVALLVGSQTAAQKKKLKQHLREGFINLLIGTHALVEDDVVFDKLGLVIIDEQHRFGVKARANLSANQPLPPDVLVMTATPIPRTLALTAYGDMDVSTLREKPPGRTPITTQVMSNDKLGELAERLRSVFTKGQQAYWVCPLVAESEELDLADATSRYIWLKQLYGEGNVGLLHGKLKAAEKAVIMQAFKAGTLQLLVATTVVEVGVDVPNATVMVIEHAERFGLAQFHQLRGRVGRGKLQSSCVLVYAPPLGGYAQARLAALRNSEDGFYLAEQDLELRGAGEVLGTAQAGQQRTRLADLAQHKHLIPVARELAEAALTQPLNGAQRNALALLLEVFDKHAAATYLRAG